MNRKREQARYEAIRQPAEAEFRALSLKAGQVGVVSDDDLKSAAALHAKLQPKDSLTPSELPSWVIPVVQYLENSYLRVADASTALHRYLHASDRIGHWSYQEHERNSAKAQALYRERAQELSRVYLSQGFVGVAGHTALPDPRGLCQALRSAGLADYLEDTFLYDLAVTARFGSSPLPLLVWQQIEQRVGSARASQIRARYEFFLENVAWNRAR